MKPAKEGAATNLNLVTASGDVYSFLLTEKNGAASRTSRSTSTPTRVRRTASRSSTARRRSRRSRRELTEARAGAEAAEPPGDGGDRRVSAAVPGAAAVRRTARRSTRSRSWCASIWHDGQFTYIKADASELPALYEVKDGKPALVNFQVHQGTYVVPKVLDDGYLALGKERFAFAQQGR